MSAPPEPPSPCVGICRLDGDGRWCIGCRRSLDEIAGWGRFDAAEKHRIIADLARREVRTERSG